MIDIEISHLGRRYITDWVYQHLYVRTLQIIDDCLHGFKTEKGMPGVGIEVKDIMIFE